MRKFYFTMLTVIVFVFNGYAQCDTYPAYGDSTMGITIQYDTAGVTSGSAGTGIVWDYSDLTVDTTGLLSHHYYDPSTTPGAENFPNANLADLTPVGVYSYFQYSPDSIIYLGDWVASVNCEIGWDPQRQTICPFSFGENFSDIYSRYRCGANAYCHTYTYRTTTSDGNGSLILPSATFPDVSRLKIQETIIDSTFLSNGTFVSTTTAIDTTYTWIDLNTNQGAFMWMYMKNVTYNYASKYIVSFNYSHIPDIVTAIRPGLADQQPAISVSPNPFSNSTTIKINDKNLKKQNFGFIMYDLLGCEVRYQQLTAGTGEYVIEKGNIPEGMYFVKIYDRDNIYTEKILIQ